MCTARLEVWKEVSPAVRHETMSAPTPPAAGSVPTPPLPTAPPAGPAASAKWGDADAMLDGVTAAMASAEPVEAEVDEPEAQRLNEKEDDEGIDGTSQTDALHSVKVEKFDSPDLALPPLLLKGLYEMNFVRPSRIQAISLPKIWAGRNLLAQSHNGTGKTACFVLGMLRAVSEQPDPQALCLCPTRELAKQISSEVEKMGKHLLSATGISIKTILREERYERGQKMTDQIVVGTPGKLWTLITMKVCSGAAMLRARTPCTPCAIPPRNHLAPHG